MPGWSGGGFVERFALGAAEKLAQVAWRAMGLVWKLRTDQGMFGAKQPFWFEPVEMAVREEVAFRAACARGGVPSRGSIATADDDQIVDAYRSTGGTVRIDGLESFATGLAIVLNFFHGQANSAMNEELDDPSPVRSRSGCRDCWSPSPT
jgi:hypothetical protein